MSDVQLALGGASFDGLVKINEMPGQGMITLRADLTDKTVIKAVKKVFAVELPAQRATEFDAANGALWMSPDEALLLCSYDEAQTKADALVKALGSSHALVVNVSDARSVFELKGDLLRDVLAKLAPVDMAPGKFESGEVRRTRLAQVAAAFWMDDVRTARVVCFRSVATYVFGVLSLAADDASAVKHFAP